MHLTAPHLRLQSPAIRPAAGGPDPKLEIYEQRADGPHLVRRTGDPATGNPTMDAAYDNALTALRYLRDRLGMDGWDGRGATTKVIANSTTHTHWDHDTGTVHLDVRPGSPPTANALDVVAHEITHGAAMTRNPGIPGNSKLGQMFANTVAMALDPDDWTLGEDVFPAKNLYDYSNPKFRFASVPGLAMSGMGDAIGRDDMVRVVFEAIPSYATTDTPQDLASKTVEAAKRAGLDAAGVDAVAAAWQQAITHLGDTDPFPGQFPA